METTAKKYFSITGTIRSVYKQLHAPVKNLPFGINLHIYRII